ncbi:cation:proton antiporter, partial [Pseudoalteromonas sp. SIMBA_148]
LGHMGLLFLEEAGGGILLGLALGALVYQLMRSIDQYQVEVMLSLALVPGGYALASALHVSGPIAMVVAGLIIGNMARD